MTARRGDQAVEAHNTVGERELGVDPEVYEWKAHVFYFTAIPGSAIARQRNQNG